MLTSNERSLKMNYGMPKRALFLGLSVGECYFIVILEVI